MRKYLEEVLVPWTSGRTWLLGEMSCVEHVVEQLATAMVVVGAPGCWAVNNIVANGLREKLWLRGRGFLEDPFEGARRDLGGELTEEGGEGTWPRKKQSQVSFLTFGSSTFMSFYYGVWVSMKFVFSVWMCLVAWSSFVFAEFELACFGLMFVFLICSISPVLRFHLRSGHLRSDLCLETHSGNCFDPLLHMNSLMDTWDETRMDMLLVVVTCVPLCCFPLFSILVISHTHPHALSLYPSLTPILPSPSPPLSITCPKHHPFNRFFPSPRTWSSMHACMGAMQRWPVLLLCN